MDETNQFAVDDIKMYFGPRFPDGTAVRITATRYYDEDGEFPYRVATIPDGSLAVARLSELKEPYKIGDIVRFIDDDAPFKVGDIAVIRRVRADHALFDSPYPYDVQLITGGRKELCRGDAITLHQDEVRNHEAARKAIIAALIDNGFKSLAAAEASQKIEELLNLSPVCTVGDVE